MQRQFSGLFIGMVLCTGTLRGICSFMGTSPAGFSISITEANDVKVGRWSVETLLRPGLAHFVNKSFKVILPWDYLVSFYKLKSEESFYYLDICE